MSITPEQVTGMANDVAELWRLVNRASAEVAEQSFVRAAYDYVAQIDADRTWVYSGARSYEWWKKSVEDEKRVLQSTLGDVASSGFVWALAESSKETASTLAEGAGDIAEAAKSGPVWGLVFAALGLFVFWRVAR